MAIQDQNEKSKNTEKETSPDAEARNDTAGTGDDTIGENTEITPIAAEILKDKEKSVQAKENQENKDPSEKNG